MSYLKKERFSYNSLTCTRKAINYLISNILLEINEIHMGSSKIIFNETVY